MGFGRTVKRAIRRWLAYMPDPTPVASSDEPKTKRGSIFSPAAVADLGYRLANGLLPRETWRAPEKPAWLERWIEAQGSDAPRLAMDSVPFEEMADYAANSSAWSEGLGFMGYAYLAELQQRSEYRRISEIWAAECTRKWIKLKGDDHARIAKLEEEMRRFGVREKFREAIELDGSQGRSHIFLDFGDKPGPDLALPLKHDEATIAVGSLKNLKVEEAYWTYPLNFNSTNPLADDFYSPSQWLVMGNIVHNSRMLTFVGRELPDLLKPVYMFGGLSLSQMAKPYVDNFIRNRTSVSNLLYSFSTMVLATDLTAMLTPQGAGELVNRIKSFLFGRDSGGLMLVNKETEELKNVSAPLSGTEELLAQAHGMICSIVGIAKVVYLGDGPNGLNASSEGELKAFYGHIHAYDEKTLTAPLTTLLRVLQLNMDGKVDEGITFEFVDLWELDAEAQARVRLTNAQTEQIYITMGVLDPEAVLERLKTEEGGLYFGVDLKLPEGPPMMQDSEDDGEEDEGKPEPDGKVNAEDHLVAGSSREDIAANIRTERKAGKPEAQAVAIAEHTAKDGWNESDHPRADNGQFGVGGTAAKAFTASPVKFTSRNSGQEYVDNQLPVLSETEKVRARVSQNALEDALSSDDFSHIADEEVDPKELKSLQNLVIRDNVMHFLKTRSHNEAKGEAPLVIRGPQGLVLVDGNHRANAALLAGEKLKAQIFDYEAHKAASEKPSPKFDQKELDDLMAELMGE